MKVYICLHSIPDSDASGSKHGPDSSRNGDLRSCDKKWVQQLKDRVESAIWHTIAVLQPCTIIIQT